MGQAMEMFWFGCFAGVGWCLGFFLVSWIDLVFSVVAYERLDFCKVVYVALTIGVLLIHFLMGG